MADEYVRKQDVVGVIEKEMKNYVSDIWYKSATHSALNDVNEGIKSLESADVVPVVRCRECNYFELNPITVVGSIPLILAHEICRFWGNGCKTSQEGFCSYGKRKE